MVNIVTKTNMEQTLSFKLSKLSVNEDVTHAEISESLFWRMMLHVRHDIVEYVVTNNFECVAYIRREFGERVKIIGTPLSKFEDMVWNTLKNHRDVYDYIPFVYDDVDSTIRNIQEKLNEFSKNMNNLFRGGLIFMNPPYQGKNTNQIYPKFWKFAIESGVEQVCMIFPTTWQLPKNRSGLSIMNTKEIKEDKHIVYIDNVRNVFNDIKGAEDVNIILWSRSHDNNLNGCQKLLNDGKDERIIRLYTKKEDVAKRTELTELVDIVKSNEGFETIYDDVSPNAPYNLRTDFLDNEKKYGYPEIDKSNTVYIDKGDYEVPNDGKTHIYGKYRKKNCFVCVDNFEFSKKPRESYEKYKVFVPKNWGNYDGEYAELGGSYSSIIIAYPYDICTEMYIEVGCFDTFYEAQCQAKYIMSKFLRFLLLYDKDSIYNSKDRWRVIPKQDYKEEWWKEDDIEKIDDHLFEKYGVPENIRECIRKVQPKEITDIRNYNKINYCKNRQKNKPKIRIKNEENSICALWED